MRGAKLAWEESSKHVLTPEQGGRASFDTSRSRMDRLYSRIALITHIDDECLAADASDFQLTTKYLPVLPISIRTRDSQSGAFLRWLYRLLWARRCYSLSAALPTSRPRPHIDHLRADVTSSDARICTSASKTVLMLFPERRIIPRQSPRIQSPYPPTRHAVVVPPAHATTRLADLRRWSSHSTQDIDSLKADPRKEPHSSKLCGERMKEKKEKKETTTEPMLPACD